MVFGQIIALIFATQCLTIFAEIKIAEQGFFEGDIVLPPSKHRNGIKLDVNKWTNNIVPYIITYSFAQKELNMIQEIMRKVERHTCLRFVQRTNEKNYINILNRGGCTSFGVGMVGGEQALSLNPDGCSTNRIVTHELFHALGLWHEQSRYDRDNYVTIHWDRLTEIGKNQFPMILQNESSVYGIAYNLGSVMHYDGFTNGFDDGVVATMEPKQQGLIWIMGKTEEAQESDWEKLRRIYQCQGTYPQGPTQLPPCKDQRDDCKGYKSDCGKVNWLYFNCPQTCGYCTSNSGNSGSGGSGSGDSGACEDKLDYCATYKNECGKTSWLKTSCRKTCNFCNCADKVTYCDQYKNQCGSLPWLNDYCWKTCGIC